MRYYAIAHSPLLILENSMSIGPKMVITSDRRYKLIYSSKTKINRSTPLAINMYDSLQLIKGIHLKIYAIFSLVQWYSSFRIFLIKESIYWIRLRAQNRYSLCLLSATDHICKMRRRRYHFKRKICHCVEIFFKNGDRY